MTAPLPFDPKRMAQRQAAAARPTPLADSTSPRPTKDAPPWSVSTLNTQIAGALRQGLPPTLRVVGEIGTFRERTHWYFDLKEGPPNEATIHCVMFASAARSLGWSPREGQQVLITGRLDFYAKQGKASLLVDAMQPMGDGALEEAFRRLCNELRTLGYFAPERKRPLPIFPRRIVAITSRTGAALQDVIDTLKRRCQAVELDILDVRVQGDRAAEEITHALRWASAHARRLGFEAILLTRGGGSKEDLAAFNDREIARAIFESSIPVVAAIGHETDTTIAELVADLRAATPTQAAMRLAPDLEALNEQLDTLHDRLRHRLLHILKARDRQIDASARLLRGAWSQHAALLGRSLEQASARLASRHPRALLVHQRERQRALSLHLATVIHRQFAMRQTSPVISRLRRAWIQSLQHRRSRIEALERQLHAVGPASVLARGFSVTTGADGRLVRSINDARPGDTLHTHVTDGRIESVVGSGYDTRATPPLAAGPDPFPKSPEATSPTHTPAHARRQKPSRGPAADGPSLFGDR